MGLSGFEWFSTALALLGVWPTIKIGGDLVRNARGIRRTLCFGSHQVVDIVTTTSETAISSVGPDDPDQRAIRSLVPSGDLAGVAEVSAMLARAYPEMDRRIVPSDKASMLTSRPMVIVGGPIHNSFAREVVRGALDHPAKEDRFTFVFDAQSRHIVFDDMELGPMIDLGFRRNVPTTEYGYVLVANLRNSGATRVLMVGGLTTYGTQAAATFAAHRLESFAKLHRLGRAPDVVILVCASLVNGDPSTFEVVAWRKF